MEKYKQELCSSFRDDCKSEDAIYEHVRDNPQFTYKLNEEGRLHSNYMGSYYEPAIIRTSGNYTCLYWLFDGKIKDCNHPFAIGITSGQVVFIRYYSSERIQTEQPISISYNNKMVITKTYNQYICFVSGRSVKILDGFDKFYRKSMNHLECFDERLFTPEFYPLYSI